MREQIQNYIRAGYPGLYIVSPEEQRVEAEIKAVAGSLDYGLHVWSTTEGLIDTAGGQGRHAHDPLEAVEAVGELTDLSLFVRKLKSCFTPEQVDLLGGRKKLDQHIRIGTTHSFKGLEADIVFLLRACQGAFPLVHPDYVLFGMFGDSEREILEDERRLFYVAITRAREQVWFLTETDRQSNFVSEVMGDRNPDPSRRH
jgi:hypothetical protein